MATKEIKAVGIHMNSKQQAIIELLNPSIATKRKEAIAKSPKVRSADLMEVPGMPRTWVMFKPGADGQTYLERFQQNVSVAHCGGGGRAKGRPTKEQKAAKAEAEEIEVFGGE